MASSDDESEIIINLLTNYHFLNSHNAPVPFSILPLHWTDHNHVVGTADSPVALLGMADGGLQSVYKEVIAWRLELSYAVPEVYALSKGNVWIKLQKPRRSYGEVVRSVMLVIRCLHFVKRNVHATGDEILSHLMKSLSSCDLGESLEKCLSAHLPLVRSAVAYDKDLAKSKYLEAFLMENENPGRKEILDEDKRTSHKFDFIASGFDDDFYDDFDDEVDDEPEELFDSVCAFCDNGGDVLICEGQCIRSFHPTVYAGVDTCCESLGFENAAQYEAIATFLCDNCKYQKHQCFVCGDLGSSDKSSAAEVFPCVSATCGHFYHPKCVAKALYPSDETLAMQLKSQIAAGESFTCPMHKCHRCQQGENKDEYELQFAICRRCPKAYHRKCLPKNIAFKSSADGIIKQRAWDDLLPKHILMYCMKHDIIPSLETPKRNHLLFPSIKRKRNQEGSITDIMIQRRSNAFGNLKKLETGKLPKVTERRCNRVAYGATAPVKVKSLTIHKETSFFHDNKSMSGNLEQPSNMVRSKSPHKDTQIEQCFSSMPVKKMVVSASPKLDAGMKTRILKLMEDSTSSFDFEEFIKEKKRRCTHEIYTPQYGLDKTITMGKVEASVKAVKAALNKLENGGSVEDAKAVCEPNVLNQLIIWKKKLHVFLAPFLHGARYTSYGRHFTKVDKLKEIVDRLHWYVEDGDTIVDFCCGSNDFSCFMKEKLDTMGKRCKFKNYDLITPKNSFEFEKRDWFSVPVEALPDGSRLVMGLNPPFGVQASLANKFINHALKFKPKLIILIVPQETTRLDCKSPPYDLIWEERGMLAGKSFYLPGSVDIRDQPLDDWNVKPPPLSLWSRPDWTSRHNQVAEKHSHIHQIQNKSHQDARFDYFSDAMTNHLDISTILDDVPEEPNATPFNCENTNMTSCTLDDVDQVVDMELSSPVIHPTNPPCAQPSYLGHPGFGPPHDVYTSVPYGPYVDYGLGVGYTQSGHYANYGYFGNSFYNGQPNYGYPAYAPNSIINPQGPTRTTYGQPHFTGDGTTYPNHRYS